jgi:hypothetical protein
MVAQLLLLLPLLLLQPHAEPALCAARLLLLLPPLLLPLRMLGQGWCRWLGAGVTPWQAAHHHWCRERLAPADADAKGAQVFLLQLKKETAQT